MDPLAYHVNPINRVQRNVGVVVTAGCHSGKEVRASHKWTGQCLCPKHLGKKRKKHGGRGLGWPPGSKLGEHWKMKPLKVRPQWAPANEAKCRYLLLFQLSLSKPTKGVDSSGRETCETGGPVSKGDREPGQQPQRYGSIRSTILSSVVETYLFYDSHVRGGRLCLILAGGSGMSVTALVCYQKFSRPEAFAVVTGMLALRESGREEKPVPSW